MRKTDRGRQGERETDRHRQRQRETQAQTGGREEEQKQDKNHKYKPGGPAFAPSQFQCRCPGESLSPWARGPEREMMMMGVGEGGGRDGEGGRRSRSRTRITSTSQVVRRLLPVSFSAGVQVRVKPEGTGPVESRGE